MWWLPTESPGKLRSTDFRLLYQPAKGAVEATVLSYRPRDNEDGYFLMMVSPTPRPDKTGIVPKDLVIALDHSGSMMGAKIDQAKILAGICAQRTSILDDRFNVIVYNDLIEPIFEGLVTNRKANVDKALGMIDRIHAGGSTNIHDALDRVLEGRCRPPVNKRAQYILFLTDGLPTVGKTNEAVILKDTLRPTRRMPASSPWGSATTSTSACSTIWWARTAGSAPMSRSARTWSRRSPRCTTRSRVRS